ncbi:MAG: ABC-2 transporter permease [Gammaproteobacteria bacterium]
MKEFSYLIRRELWEHRALYIVPLVFAGLVLLSVTVGIVRGTQYLGAARIATQMGSLTPDNAGAALIMMTYGMWFLFSIVSLFVVTFYMLDALYGDRKDRSVLFWKSLPISDTQTVLSKLVTAVVVMPAIVLVAALVTMFAVLIILSIAIALGGVNPFPLLWAEIPLFTLLSNMISIELLHSLWFLPVTGWLLLSSSAAKRTPFLLAALVPLGLIFAEKLAFNTQWFANTVGEYARRFYEPLFGDVTEVSAGADGFQVEGLDIEFAQIGELLADPVLYVGVVLGTVFIFAAIWMRRHRIDIS